MIKQNEKKTIAIKEQIIKNLLAKALLESLRPGNINHTSVSLR
jgi:hypothetical protein